MEQKRTVMLSKLEKSEKVAQDYLREHAKEVRLKQETRRLKEEDLRKLNERHKRLDLSRKRQIIER